MQFCEARTGEAEIVRNTHPKMLTPYMTNGYINSDSCFSVLGRVWPFLDVLAGSGVF